MALHKIAGAWISPTRDGGVAIRIPGLLGQNTVVLLPNRYKDTQNHPDYNVLVEILTEEEKKAREEYRENADMIKNAVPAPQSAPATAQNERLPELPDGNHFHVLGSTPNGSAVWKAVHKDDFRVGDVVRTPPRGWHFKQVSNPVTPNNATCYRLTGQARQAPPPAPARFDKPVPTDGTEELTDPFAE